MESHLFSKRSARPADPAPAQRVARSPLGELLNGSSRAQGLAQLKASLNGRTEAPETVQRKNDTGIPDGLKAGVEALSGMSMDDVRVHRNSSQPAQLNALAYARGTEIHLGPGQERHLAHEVWHVAQQKQGRVQPTVQAKGVPVNDDAGLEREADVMGERAEASETLAQRLQGSAPSAKNGVVQRASGGSTPELKDPEDESPSISAKPRRSARERTPHVTKTELASRDKEKESEETRKRSESRSKKKLNSPTRREMELERLKLKPEREKQKEANRKTIPKTDEEDRIEQVKMDAKGEEESEREDARYEKAEKDFELTTTREPDENKKSVDPQAKNLYDPGRDYPLRAKELVLETEQRVLHLIDLKSDEIQTGSREGATTTELANAEEAKKTIEKLNGLQSEMTKAKAAYEAQEPKLIAQHGENDVMRQSPEAEAYHKAVLMIAAEVDKLYPPFSQVRRFHQVATQTDTEVTHRSEKAKVADFHTGAEDDPIPVVWYKRPTDYVQFDLPGKDGKTVHYPPGAKIPVMIKNVEREVGPGEGGIARIIGNGKRFYNLRKPNASRKVSGEVREALKQQYGEKCLVGLDIDHIQDLGFGGLDGYDNLWPLNAEINRRAVQWRAQYGVNYLSKTEENPQGQVRTAAIDSLIGKYFVIRDGNVPKHDYVPDKDEYERKEGDKKWSAPLKAGRMDQAKYKELIKDLPK